jgi:predicted ATP-dependent endonuclease of OLD family
MLHRIDIRNFQCHKDRGFNLEKGLNSIVGETDVGKSAIIRALTWVILNRPSGFDFLRTGAKYVSVRLQFSDGTVVKRFKSKKTNKYVVNGKTYKAFGNDIPAPVLVALKLSSLNIQKQLDSPFWFDLSPGQVSKNLNKIVDLSIVDEVFQTISKDLRKKKTEHEVISGRLKDDREEAKSLKWTKLATRDLAKLASLEKCVEDSQGQAATIESLIGQAAVLDSEIRTAEKQMVGLPSPEDVERTAKEVQLTENTVRTLSDALEQYYEAENTIVLLEKLDLSDTTDTVSRLETNFKERRALFDLLYLEESESRAIEINQAELSKAEKELRKLTKNGCPLCHQKIPHTH